jgi:hypothetical protein
LAVTAGTVLAVVTWLVLLFEAVPPASDGLDPVRLRDWATSDDRGMSNIEAPRGMGRGPTVTRPLAPKPVDPGPQGPDAVIGAVRDRISGEAIPAFQVDVLEHAAGSPLDRLKDSVPLPFHVRSGVFRVDKSAGRWDIVVRAPGYEPLAMKDIQLPAESFKPIPMELDRGAGISGIVYDRTNQAVPRIKVFLHVQGLDDPDAKPPRISIAHTGLDGRFHFSPLPAGQYALSLLELDNTIDFRGGIRVRPNGQTVEIPMLLTERHQVQIVVRNLRNEPLDGARVVLRSDDHYTSAATNANGMAVLSHVPDGSYTATANLNGFREAEQTFELSGGSGNNVHWMRLARDRDD